MRHRSQTMTTAHAYYARSTQHLTDVYHLAYDTQGKWKNHPNPHTPIDAVPIEIEYQKSGSNHVPISRATIIIENNYVATTPFLYQHMKRRAKLTDYLMNDCETQCIQQINNYARIILAFFRPDFYYADLRYFIYQETFGLVDESGNVTFDIDNVNLNQCNLTLVCSLTSVSFDEMERLNISRQCVLSKFHRSGFVLERISPNKTKLIFVTEFTLGERGIVAGLGSVKLINYNYHEQSSNEWAYKFANDMSKYLKFGAQARDIKNVQLTHKTSYLSHAKMEQPKLKYQTFNSSLAQQKSKEPLLFDNYSKPSLIHNYSNYSLYRYDENSIIICKTLFFCIAAATSTLVILLCIVIICMCCKGNKDKSKTGPIQQLSPVLNSNIFKLNNECHSYQISQITRGNDKYHQTHKVDKKISDELFVERDGGLTGFTTEITEYAI